jgi:hypothetical protein
MITETEADGRKFKHFYFFENCDDDPIAVLALVEKMFAEIALMPRHNWKGETWFMRVAPQIERQREFGGPMKAQVGCRFSSEEVPHDPEPLLFGFGKETA